MPPQMQRVLVELSAFYHPEPAAVFRRVVDAVAAQYPGAMAMVNLVDGDRLRFHAVANPLPVLRGDSLPLSLTW